MGNLSIFVYINIWFVVVGISTLMSNFDGLGLYIFHREMENMRHQEENGLKGVYFPPELIFCYS